MASGVPVSGSTRKIVAMCVGIPRSDIRRKERHRFQSESIGSSAGIRPRNPPGGSTLITSEPAASLCQQRNSDQRSLHAGIKSRHPQIRRTCSSSRKALDQFSLDVAVECRDFVANA
jgi:hypothetical protein